MTSQGVEGTVDKAGRILPDSNQRVENKLMSVFHASVLSIVKAAVEARR